MLTERSLTVPAADAERTVVHRLVQRVVRERCHQAGTLDAVITAAADAVQAAAEQIGDAWATRTLIGEYAAHADTLTTHHADDSTRRRLISLRMWMLHWLREVHNYSAAATLGPPLLDDCERILGNDDSTTTGHRNNLADVYRAVGRLDEAITLYEQTLTDRRAGARPGPPRHPDLAQQPRLRLPGGGAAGRGDHPARADPRRPRSGCSARTTPTP